MSQRCQDMYDHEYEQKCRQHAMDRSRKFAGAAVGIEQVRRRHVPENSERYSRRVADPPAGQRHGKHQPVQQPVAQFCEHRFEALGQRDGRRRVSPPGQSQRNQQQHRDPGRLVPDEQLELLGRHAHVLSRPAERELGQDQHGDEPVQEQCAGAP